MTQRRPLPFTRPNRAWIRALALLVGFAFPLFVRAEPVAFDIPAGKLANALLEFSKQARVEMLFAYDELAEVPSSGVFGRYEPTDALALLLRYTNFTAHRNSRGKFAITRARQPAGSLTGRLLTPEGAGASGVQVSIPDVRTSILTNPNGEFTFSNLPPGSYRIVASAANFRTLEINGASVEADRMLHLETQAMQRASDPTQLEPYIVHDKSGRDEAFDRSHTPLIPQTATGNLDLSRTENDAVPYTIFDRKQIIRSGVVNLNEFLQREVLEGDPSAQTPEQTGSEKSYVAGSTNLNLRGYDSDETVILVNGRRLPEILTSAGGNAGLPPDVSLIPVALVEQIEVLPVSASALYSGNPVGGVINIVLRPAIDLTEVTTTYTNALARFDAPQASVSLQNGQTLLKGALRVRLSATFTKSEPATEAELGHIAATNDPNVADYVPLYRATPNIRSADGFPIVDGSLVTSVAPGANGMGGNAAFANRGGVRNLALFAPAQSPVASIDSRNYPYGREQERESYFLSTNFEFSPSLQVGVDATYAHTVVNHGYDAIRGDLTLSGTSPYNPFPGHDISVSLVEMPSKLGKDYDEARFQFFSVVAGALLKLPSDWRVAVDSQFARNVTKYRGIGGADTARWQGLVDSGIYNPFRDTQVYGPPTEFYDQVLTYRGGRGKFVTVGDYDTLDASLRVSNHMLSVPTGSAVLNLGTDYRRIHLASYLDQRYYSDGSPAGSPFQNSKGRTLQRVSVFGELQAPLLPKSHLPSWIDVLETDLAVRYIAADTSRETNIAPTIGMKAEFKHGFALRGTFTTSNRVPTPQLSLAVYQPGDGIGGVNLTTILDPRRNEKYGVAANDAPSPNLSPESAVSQTAGVLFKHGKHHKIRASLDFVDTRKTNEVKVLTAQAVVDLESVFPSRVVRAAQPSGLITSVVTGAVNLASRHSQNWNGALDYSGAEFLGGKLEAYARLVYFQKYEIKINPTSGAVNEVDHPDTVNFGLLKYRANFGASWANADYGFGFDGHYFHSRPLPQVEAALQHSHQIDAYLPFDVYLQSDLGRWLPWKDPRYGLRGQIRVNNILGAEFPRYISSEVGLQPYGDWRGRTYSLSLTATF